jgi:glycosyltransferase involved in cell wall biosynthesis
MLKCLCLQNFVSHYRRRLFELLSRSDEIHFTIASDNQSESTGIEVANLKTSNIRWKFCTSKLLPRSPFYWHPQFMKLACEEKPDAVVTIGNPYVLTSWALLLWGKVTRTPIILWTHGLLGPESGFRGYIRLYFYRLASALLLYGDHAKTLLANSGIDPRRMFVIYNSLDSETQERFLREVSPSDVNDFRLRMGISPKEPLVIFSGRLQANKKLAALLDAVGILRTRKQTVHVVFIGEGQEKSALTNQSELLGIASQIHFLGESYDERFIATAFMASDLSVIPSGAGLSVMHALGYGVPVLLHDQPEQHFPEWEAIQEGETGFFYKNGDTDDMANKIEAALFPTPQKEAMKERCLSMIRSRYNASAHSEAIISAVKQIVEQKS